MMEQDGPRAKEVFGRLTSGIALRPKIRWCWRGRMCIWGTIYDIEGQPDRAKSEYQAALAVDGAPESQAGGSSVRRHGPYQISGTPVSICATCPPQQNVADEIEDQPEKCSMVKRRSTMSGSKNVVTTIFWPDV
jgi:hypothetical protein